MTLALEAGEELVEKDHLARVHDEPFERLLARVGPRLGALEQVRVVRRLLELHRNVKERHVLVGAVERGVVLRASGFEKVSKWAGDDDDDDDSRRARRRTLVRMFLYHHVCMLDISMRRLRSLLVGSSLMTSRLRRRSMIDSSLLCRSRIFSSFSSSAGAGRESQ